MIRSSFIFLTGVGDRTERELWRRGITGWDTYRAAPAPDLPPRVVRQRSRHVHQLELAERCIAEGRLAPFARWLSPSDTWRLLDVAGPRVLYFDIETSGSSWPQGRMTVLGAHMPKSGTRLLVRGRDLDTERVQEMVDDAQLLVSFNGRGFDAPWVEQEFGVSMRHVAHLDLMIAFRKLGIRGGLKRIEHQFGLARPDHVQGLSGWDAVKLWNRHERGDPRALQALLDYNEADVMNLVPLARHAYERLRQTTWASVATDTSGDPLPRSSQAWLV